MRGRILVVDHRTPTPDQDSGSASAFSYLRILARAGFEVTFAPFDLRHAGSYTEALNRLGIRTLSEPEWTSMTSVIETIGPRCDVLLLYRGAIAGQIFDLARRVAPAARILFHPVDLSFLRMQRQAVVSGDQALAEAARTMRATELDLIARADATIVVSTGEIDLLRQLRPDAVVHQIPILRETPARWPSTTGWRGFLGGRFDGWIPAGRRRDLSFRGRRDFLFIGGYEHLPNVDAVQWFVREVWPCMLAKGFPDRFIIAGSKVPDEIAALASDQIDVRGYVEDLAPLFEACRLSIAPLRYGAGVKGKIVTSLSFGVPVVATTIAAEGMRLQHEQDVLVADTPEAMAGQILWLYNDADLWQRLSSRGYRTFCNHFSLASGGGRVVSIVSGLVAAGSRN
jgi:glycosyltransferase involved in cell wall biosynthesis